MTNSSDVDYAPALGASVQILPLPAGLYLFSVKEAVSNGRQEDGRLRVPAMHVGLGPGVRSDQVEFMAGPATNGAWLFAKEDLLVTKVGSAGATLVLTSVRAPGGEVLTIKVERLEDRSDEAAPVQQPPVTQPLVAAAQAPSDKQKNTSTAKTNDAVPVPLHITAHIRTRGDMGFTNTPWAGRTARGLWIESFAIRPLERFSVQDIEYKALTGSGFETPWLSDETMCGTKGMAVPLVGFAVRLKASCSGAAAYDCEYSGYFKSGVTVGPLRNGTPCRSTVANDALEGIQMRIIARAITAPSAKWESALGKNESNRTANRGPTFGRYRDDNGLNSGDDIPTATKTSAPALGVDAAGERTSKLEPAGVSASRSNGSANSAKRLSARA